MESARGRLVAADEVGLDLRGVGEVGLSQVTLHEPHLRHLRSLEGGTEEVALDEVGLDEVAAGEVREPEVLVDESLLDQARTREDSAVDHLTVDHGRSAVRTGVPLFVHGGCAAVLTRKNSNMSHVVPCLAPTSSRGPFEYNRPGQNGEPILFQ